MLLHQLEVLRSDLVGVPARRQEAVIQVAFRNRGWTLPEGGFESLMKWVRYELKLGSAR